MTEIVAKKLKKPQLEGFSERQLEEHHGILYKGYVNKLNERLAKLIR
ncbi:MAG: hypothetical protein DDT30_00733 [Dehalococcoidia bacterium]|nr:hypothetical protein [Bacillota bacterium]MBT9143507.1 hypothetical protein [Bacillota bacterium]